MTVRPRLSVAALMAVVAGAALVASRMRPSPCCPGCGPECRGGCVEDVRCTSDPCRCHSRQAVVTAVVLGHWSKTQGRSIDWLELHDVPDDHGGARPSPYEFYGPPYAQSWQRIVDRAGNPVPLSSIKVGTKVFVRWYNHYPETVIVP